ERRKFQPEHGGEAIVVCIERDAEEGWTRNAGDAGIAVGQINPVDEHDADDLAEGKRDDGQIIAAQPQDGKAEQNSPERSEDACKRQENPEREPERLCEQGIGVGADRVKGDVTKVEQSSEAYNNVQTPSKHDIDQDLDSEIVDPLDRTAEAGGGDD